MHQISRHKLIQASSCRLHQSISLCYRPTECALLTGYATWYSLFASKLDRNPSEDRMARSTHESFGRALSCDFPGGLDAWRPRLLSLFGKGNTTNLGLRLLLGPSEPSLKATTQAIEIWHNPRFRRPESLVAQIKA